MKVSRMSLFGCSVLSICFVYAHQLHANIMLEMWKWYAQYTIVAVVNLTETNWMYLIWTTEKNYAAANNVWCVCVFFVCLFHLAVVGCIVNFQLKAS